MGNIWRVSTKKVTFSFPIRVKQLSHWFEPLRRAPGCPPEPEEAEDMALCKGKRKAGGTESAAEMVRIKRETQAVVESLIDGCVEESSLVAKCPHLSQSDYQDVTIERSIVKICGYPLCCNQLTSVPKQRFHIVLQEHKVYDLKERGMFCSNLCFKASNYLNEQLSPEPIWMGDHQEQAPVAVYKETRGEAGKHVPLLSMAEESEPVPPVIGMAKNKKKKVQEVVGFPYIQEEQLNALKESMDALEVREKPVEMMHPISEPNRDQNQGRDEKRSPQREGVKRCGKSVVEMTLKEWVTSSTLRFIYGNEEYVKRYNQMMESREDIVNETSKKEAEENRNKLCQKLDNEERLEQVFDQLSLASQIQAVPVKADRSSRGSKKDGRVGAKGVDGSPEAKSSCCKSSEKKDNKKWVTFKRDFERGEEEAVNEDMGRVYPLVDSCSQNAIRRKIVETKISDFLAQVFGLNLAAKVMYPMNAMVKTFRLTPTNIVLKKDMKTMYKSDAIFMLEKRFYSRQEWDEKTKTALSFYNENNK